MDISTDTMAYGNLSFDPIPLLWTSCGTNMDRRESIGETGEEARPFLTAEKI